MHNKTSLITGATSGIGKAAAKALARMGYRVILLGRNKEKLKRTFIEIRRESPGAKVDTCICDLSLMKDVYGIADSIRANHDRIDVLINNAGARFIRHELTVEGVEMTLATNHLGHFVLTLSLIDLLKKSEQGRIINVSSGAHLGGIGVIENILSPRSYDGHKQYANSKLANIQFTYALSEKLKGLDITANAVNPGAVATNFARNNGWFHWFNHRVYYLIKGQLLTPQKGAGTIVSLSTSISVSNFTGQYFAGGRTSKSSDMSYDHEAQQNLWAMSAALTGIDL